MTASETKRQSRDSDKVVLPKVIEKTLAADEVKTSLRRIDPPRLVRDEALHILREAIITGQLRPGTRLIERELCEAMGVSRASIREVIRKLEAEKLLKVGLRRKLMVAGLNRKQAMEIYELREIIEIRLIREFTRIATDEQIADLRLIARDVLPAAQARDLRALMDVMIGFNKHIARTVNHEIFEDILDHVNARISWLRMTSMSNPGRIEESLGEIEEIVRAVEARDPDRASDAVFTYVINARNAAIMQLEQGE